MELYAIAILGLVIAIVVYFFRRPKQQLLELPPGPLKGEKTFIPFELIAKREISHDTKVYDFKLKDDESLGLDIGKHIILRAKIPTEASPEGEVISRKYTPTSTLHEKGRFSLLIKIYFKNVHPKFPQGGMMSQYVDSLQIGDTIDVSGPKGNLSYQGNGLVHIFNKGEINAKTYKHFAFIAGGTGITPAYQIIQYMLSEDKQYDISLLFANKTEDDILLYDELKDLPIKKYFVLDTPPKGWTGGEGFVTEDMLRKNLPYPSPETVVAFCGPPPMNRMIRTQLVAMGHHADNIFKF